MSLSQRLVGFIRSRYLVDTLVLFAVALVIRVIGINYGYFHGDERINDSAKVLAGQLVPMQHFYPPLLNYMNAVAFVFLYAGGRLLSVWDSTAEFRAQYFSDPTPFYVAARFVTMCLGAAVAPLFYAFASLLRMPRWAALIVGALGLAVPAMVMLSHFAKSDIGLTSSTVLVLLTLLLKLERPKSRRIDACIGISIALALSFKHSFVFILAPLTASFIYLFARANGARDTLRSAGVVALWLVPTWCVLNIGILLDLDNFIGYQKVQAIMSARSGQAFLPALDKWFSIAVSESGGVTIVVALLHFAFPFYGASRLCRLPHRPFLLAAWASITLAMLVIIKISGTRQHSGLWVSYYACMQLFVALMLADGLRSSLKAVRAVSGVALALGLGLALHGVIVIKQQALAEPIVHTLDRLLLERYRDRKVLTTRSLSLPRPIGAYAEEIEREERLAKKYGIALPERARDREQVYESVEGGVFWRTLPQPWDGLQNTTDEAMEGAVKPYGWPPQAEEWQLATWRELGYSVFLVTDPENRPPMEQAFWAELQSNCRLVKRLEARKPLFLEWTTTVFEC